MKPDKVKQTTLEDATTKANPANKKIIKDVVESVVGMDIEEGEKKVLTSFTICERHVELFEKYKDRGFFKNKSNLVRVLLDEYFVGLKAYLKAERERKKAEKASE